MVFKVLLACCLVVVSQATSNSTAETRDVMSTSETDDLDDDDINDANDFVDQILEQVKDNPKVLEKITPLEIGNLEHSGFRLSNVRLHGLESVYRSDNCTFRFSNTSFDILAHLGARDLRAESAWARTWLYIPFGGYLEAKVVDFSILMDINVGKNGTPSLQRLKVVRLSDIQVTKATGASVIFNWALRYILNWAVNANKDAIVRLIETDGAVAISEGMKGLGDQFNTLNEFRRRR